MTYNPDHVFAVLDNLTGMLQELIKHNQPGYIDRLNHLWTMWSYQTYNDRELEQTITLLLELRSQLNLEAEIARDGSARQSPDGGSGQETPSDSHAKPDETGLQFPPDSPGDFRGPY